MKRLGVLFLLVALLCGCQAEEPQVAVSVPPQPTEAALPPPGLYAPGHRLEAGAQGALRVYIPEPGLIRIAPMGEKLLLIHSSGQSSTLRVMAGERGHIEAQLTLPLPPEELEPRLQVTDHGVRYRQGSETVLLSGSLQEIARIPDPEGTTAPPLLSGDGATLYYCAQGSIYAQDTASGLSRILLENAGDRELQALLLGDTILQTASYDDYWGWQYHFLSAKTGATLAEADTGLLLCTSETRYYAAFPDGSAQSYVFGAPGEPPQALLPEDLQELITFLPALHGAVSTGFSQDYDRSYLQYYDVEAGTRAAWLPLESGYSPWNLCASEDFVWFTLYDPALDQELICRWDPGLSLTRDRDPHTRQHHTRENPDAEMLALCADLAQALGEPLGIHIRVWEDAAAAQPWDYDLEPEHRADLTLAALEKLELWLGRFPEGFLNTLADCSDSLSICLVRSLTGSAESGSLASADGIQFWQGGHSYIALALGFRWEQTLCHELSHVIDTQVLGHSGLYDDWEKLNPRDFRYDYDYIANQSRDGSPWLKTGQEAFVDTYSMSYPKEDRARIFEYAMTEGHAQLFQSSILQRKLLTICTAIREAFDLEAYPEPLPWEQYLLTSLVPEG